MAKQKRKRLTVPFGDGRFEAQYAEDHMVCAYCWGKLTQRYDADDGRWYAVCAANEAHIGFHHVVFKEREISRDTVTSAEIRDFYRRSAFAAEFGLTPPLTGQALQDQLASMKRVLGRDDSGF